MLRFVITFLAVLTTFFTAAHSAENSPDLEGDAEICQSVTWYDSINRVIGFTSLGLSHHKSSKLESSYRVLHVLPKLFKMKKRNLSCGIGTNSYKDLRLHNIQKYSGKYSNAQSEQLPYSPYMPRDGLSGAKDSSICLLATSVSRNVDKTWSEEFVWSEMVLEAKHRGLKCGVNARARASRKEPSDLKVVTNEFARLRQETSVLKAENEKRVVTISNKTKMTNNDLQVTDTGTRDFLPRCPKDDSDNSFHCFGDEVADNGDRYLGEIKNERSHGRGIYYFSNGDKYVGEFKNGKQHGKGSITSKDGDIFLGHWKNNQFDGLGALFFNTGQWKGAKFIGEFKEGRLSGRGFVLSADGRVKAEGIYENDIFQHSKVVRPLKFSWNTEQKFFKNLENQIIAHASTSKIESTQPNTPSSAELQAAQRKAEELEQQLAALKAEQEQQQQTISNDTQIPLITIASANTKGKQGVILGRASDNVGVAEITASGQQIPFDASGNFQYQTFVPTGGKDIVIEVTDVAGLTSKQTVSLTRSAVTATSTITQSDTPTDNIIRLNMENL
jgi:hypothetical protein